ncbi:hypothetical protein TIFTF001_042441 [Ficus carica]|uniref:Uncharacterized protein n=1 Tax=Ficus carica TaxID=3494 RepID=A0AA88CY94_FICCA|nr:hypothetical protein TIFTF001_042441 [Ficus carica]
MSIPTAGKIEETTSEAMTEIKARRKKIATKHIPIWTVMGSSYIGEDTRRSQKQYAIEAKD